MDDTTIHGKIDSLPSQIQQVLASNPIKPSDNLIKSFQAVNVSNCTNSATGRKVVLYMGSLFIPYSGILRLECNTSAVTSAITTNANVSTGIAYKISSSNDRTGFAYDLPSVGTVFQLQLPEYSSYEDTTGIGFGNLVNLTAATGSGDITLNTGTVNVSVASTHNGSMLSLFAYVGAINSSTVAQSITLTSASVNIYFEEYSQLIIHQ